MAATVEEQHRVCHGRGVPSAQLAGDGPGVPKSSRRPWIRTGLMGLVPFLLPFVWLLEIDSCGHPVPTTMEITGSMIVGKFDVEGWLVIVPVLLVVLLTPFFAARVPSLGYRVLMHLAGFLGAALAAYGALFAMFFTIFSTREAKGVGWIVIALFLGSVGDAIARLAWSLQEWRSARQPRQ